MIVAYLGLAALVVYGWTINARTLQEEARRKAAETATVQACILSRPQVANVSRFVQGVNELALAIVENNAATVEFTPRSSPMYAVRRANLLRIIRARENVKAISRFPVPTVAQCRGRAEH